jgi:putative SOS response-associated peptidase YedK
MCGRFTLTADDIASLAREWAAEVDPALAAGWRPRFNAAPGDRHPVLVEAEGCRRLISASFGLAGARPAGARSLLINARVETAASRPTFREAWRNRRAAVPADGFFEWEGPSSARRPTWFHLPGRAPMLLAALLGEAPGGGTGFAVLTCPARAPVQALHDRMPVLLPPALLDAWLAGPPPTLPDLSRGGLVARRVSPRINSVENDDPGCLEEGEAEAQGKLF